MERNTVGIRGAQATIKWGYHVAAQLGRWQFAGSGDAGGQVAAAVVSRDVFRLQQTPLTLVLRMDSVTMIIQDGTHVPGKVAATTLVRWPVIAIADQGDTVIVTVGPMERTGNYGPVPNRAAGNGAVRVG